MAGEAGNTPPVESTANGTAASPPVAPVATAPAQPAASTTDLAAQSLASAPANQPVPQAGQVQQTPAYPPEVQAQLDELAQLRQWRQRSEPLVNLGYQQYLADQQARRAQAEKDQQAQANQPWVKLPEFNRDHLQFIARDEHGNIVAKPGAPPDLVQRYQDFQKEYERLSWDMVTNPQKVLAEPVRRLAEQIANEVVQKHLGGFQEQQQVQAILRQSEAWMFATDAAGNRVVTPQGRRYHEIVCELDTGGVKNSQLLHQIAVERLQNEALMARYRQEQAGQQAGVAGDAAKQQFLIAAADGRAASPGPATPPSAAPPATPALPGEPQPSLRDALLRAFEQNGYQPGQTLARG